jgi:hypothetical protein
MYVYNNISNSFTGKIFTKKKFNLKNKILKPKQQIFFHEKKGGPKICQISKEKKNSKMCQIFMTSSSR